ncbi:Protein of unknown function [Pyronema omphalodes CBS 100304]|uniref:Uncharacterized protein n=1 Tax=Pyronema omphalodes (strain CBS 100304) TaxID=1076935 RepID=U4LGD9_PYROM|nr:Protein of unknown function [Pyronema omphalodes CBS 100304]
MVLCGILNGAKTEGECTESGRLEATRAYPLSWPTVCILNVVPLIALLVKCPCSKMHFPLKLPSTHDRV